MNKEGIATGLIVTLIIAASIVSVAALITHSSTQHSIHTNLSRVAAAEKGCNWIEGEIICIPSTSITRTDAEAGR